MTALPISAIRRDGGTQPRDKINIGIAQEYAEAMADGERLPPVTVFYDGSDYWLADGFHRVEAHELLELTAVSADVRQGTRRDAILYSLGANADHGFQRSAADKRRAVLALLNDPEWSRWSDSDIRKHCRVSLDMVQRHRASITYRSVSGDRVPPAPSVPDKVLEKTREIEAAGGKPRIYTTKHGTISVMDTAAIGAQRKLLVAGRVPDHRPDPNMGRSEDCGLAEAARLTGIEARKLVEIARTGEIDGAAKEGGSWYFKTEDLRQWMKSAPEAPEKGSRQLRDFLGRIREGEDTDSAADAAGIGRGEAKLHAEAEQAGEYADINVTTKPAPVVDISHVPLARRLFEMFIGWDSLGTPDDALAAWKASPGQPLPPEAVTSAAEWIAEFAARFPAIEAERRLAVNSMLERIEANVS